MAPNDWRMSDFEAGVMTAAAQWHCAGLLRVVFWGKKTVFARRPRRALQEKKKERRECKLYSEACTQSSGVSGTPLGRL